MAPSMATQHPHHDGMTPGDDSRNMSPTPNSQYKRASRKGAPRKFICSYPSCDKVYSRAEHLQRHQLNHEPREIYRCDIPGCEQKFVRADLLARHKKRHSSSYIPRNRAPSFNVPLASPNSPTPTSSIHPGATVAPSAPSLPRPHFPPHSTSGPHDAAILLTPDANTNGATTAVPTSTLSNAQSSHTPTVAQHPAWPAQPMDGMDVNMMRPRQASYYGRDPPPLAETASMMPFGTVGFQSDAQLPENFATWLFDSTAGFNDLSAVANIPFLEGGLESTFNNNIHYDYESLTSQSQLGLTPPNQVEMSDEHLGEHRRQEVLRWFQVFRSKQPKYEPSIVSFIHESGGDLPALDLDMMRHCLHEYWANVSPRLPIVHQPTFSPNRCPIFLLMVMLALGASSLHARDTAKSFADYVGFGDVIISSVRWEILTADEASPPVGLWVAQALLLLEFYEKLCSSRKFHERAHIYHSATLTLLRRGSPLIGRAGSESPPEEQVPPAHENAHGVAPEPRTWWIRWAETESMHRVVFGAFMMDIIHAAMFGHLADMAPHEIRLPLPCDDGLWMAPNPENFRHVDSTYRMYGIKQISFLDGLKSALHCNPVKTHSFGRMIVMSGLLSVGWHLSHRESHLKWLDRGAPNSSEKNDGNNKNSWRRTLFRAFDVWKESFDADIGTAEPVEGSANGPIHSAAVLYHLAYLSLHVDIVNCQVYAGAKRLVGRKVSTRDYANSVSRTRAWAGQASTRHAILHAFKLLHRVLVCGGNGTNSGTRNSRNGFHHNHESVQQQQVSYSARGEADPHRPWILYYAILSIWCFVRALRGGSAGHPLHLHLGSYGGTVEYLSRVAGLRELNEESARGLADGLPDLLGVLHDSLEGSPSEILREACERLKVCREMMAQGGQGPG